MKEQLFQFIWQQQLFNMQDLRLTSGELVEILFPGELNTNQGPDFIGARIRFNNTLWCGQVELHIKASDWFRHFHNDDHNYDNVILHVVWENDQLIFEDLRTLVLQDRISTILLERFSALKENRSFIPCQPLLITNNVPRELDNIDVLLKERFNRKAETIFPELSTFRNHWEAILWHKVARAFGGSINGDAFEQMAQSIPFNVLQRLKVQIHQLESVMLGQCGLLDEPSTDDYVVLLSKEYQFLKRKFSLSPIRNPVHFLRMRPSNFPTVRLAQLAMFMHVNPPLFDYFLHLEDIRDCVPMFDITANDFWHYHYSLRDKSNYKPKKLGLEMLWAIVINAIIPVMYAYGSFHKDEILKKKALGWLKQIPAESNSILHSFKKLGFRADHADETQSLLELKKAYCDVKRCLECEIGNQLLARQPAPSGN